MKKGILAAAALAALILCGCNKTSKFKALAKIENAKCPIRMNESIVLDSINYNEDANTMNYYYNITGVLNDPVYMKENYDEIKQTLQEGLDDTPEMNQYWEFGTTVNYIYFSRTTRQKLAEFSFTSSTK